MTNTKTITYFGGEEIPLYDEQDMRLGWKTDFLVRKMTPEERVFYKKGVEQIKNDEIAGEVCITHGIDCECSEKNKRNQHIYWFSHGIIHGEYTGRI